MDLVPAGFKAQELHLPSFTLEQLSDANIISTGQYWSGR